MLQGDQFSTANGASSKSDKNVAQKTLEELNADLIEAAKNGNIEQIVQLINQGAQVNTTDKYHNTPLIFAVLHNHPLAIEKLIEHKASIDAKNINGHFPLYFATRKNNLQVTEILLKNGASVDTKVSNGGTVLHYASRDNHPQIIEILLKYGASIDAKDHAGNTPLLYAAFYKKLDAAKVLLLHHANVDLLGFCGRTPLHHATETYKLAQIFATTGIDQFSTEKPNRFFLSQQTDFNDETALDLLKRTHADFFSYTPSNADKKAECSGTLVEGRSQELREHAFYYRLARMYKNGMIRLPDNGMLEAKKNIHINPKKINKNKLDPDMKKKLQQINSSIGLGLFFQMDPNLQTHTMTFLAPNPERFTFAESQRAINIVESAPWPLPFDRKRKREELPVEDKGKEKQKEEEEEDYIPSPSTKRVKN